MRVITLDRVRDWTRGAEILALAALAWATLLPGGVFWAGVLAGCLVGSAAATAVLVHSQTIPTLTQLIGSAGAEPAAGLSRTRGGAILCPGGERTS